MVRYDLFWKAFRENNITKCEEIFRNIKLHDINSKMIASMINLYGKCKERKKCEILWKQIELNKKNDFVWGSIINFYKRLNDSEMIVQMYKQLRDQTDIIPTKYILSILLSLDVKYLIRDQKLYDDLLDCVGTMNLNDNDIVFDTSLINFYGKVGEIGKAEHVFEGIKNKYKDVILWTSMMKCYVDNRYYDNALKLYFSDEMKSIRNIINCCVGLNACAYLRDIKRGTYIINEINEYKYTSIELQNAMIHYYGKINDITGAKNTFDVMDKDVISCNSMMNAYVDCGLYSDALELLFSDNMAKCKDYVSYVIGINACTHLKDKINGDKIYEIVINNNYKDIELFNGLINFYGKLNDINKAQSIFRSINNKNVVTYNSIMQAYLDNELYSDTISMFFSDELISVRDSISCLIALNACIHGMDTVNGKLICEEISKRKYNVAETINCVINFYGKANNIEKARKVFDSVESNTMDVIILNAMLSAYIDNNKYDEVLLLFNSDEMRSLRNNITYIIAINACALLKDKHAGIEIYNEIINSKLYDIEIYNALINYFSCINDMEMVQTLFDSMEFKNSSTYNSMMKAYRDNEMYSNAISAFNENSNKDIVSYIQILSIYGNLGTKIIKEPP